MRKKMLCLLFVCTVLVSACSKAPQTDASQPASRSSSGTAVVNSQSDPTPLGRTVPEIWNHWYFNFGQNHEKQYLESGDTFHGLLVEEIMMTNPSIEPPNYWFAQAKAVFLGEITLSGTLTIAPGHDTLVYHSAQFMVAESSQGKLPWAVGSGVPTAITFENSPEELLALTGYSTCTDVPATIILDRFTFLDYPMEVNSYGRMVSFTEL